MPLVEVTDLFVSFGARPAVDGISFSVEPGERFGLIGESGSGKSLTALAIAGLLPAAARSDGTIAFNGALLPDDDTARATLRGRHIGMIFQEPMTALNPLMRIGKQVGEAVTLHFPRSEVFGRVTQLLNEVGLDALHAERYPHQLSGGQRQRVMIAIALAAEPELLICDEPTSALDLITQRVVLSLLENVCKARGMALIFISHDLKAVATLCTRLMVMRTGKQIETGTTDAIFSDPQRQYTQNLVATSRVTVPPLREVSTHAPLLEVKDVTRRFATAGLPFLSKVLPVVAVNQVSFSIGAGEAVALVGPSGCGKSTLARVIVGLDRPNAGTLALGGHNYVSARRQPMPKNVRRDLSLVFQDPFGSFNPRQSVGDAVGEPLRLLSGLSPIQKLDHTCEAIEAVGMQTDILHRYPHEFSGGQRQRLAIARALVTRPRLVVLDEPVSALDVSIRGDVLALLNHLRSEFGLAYLMISHDLEMVRMVTDRIMVMDAGRIVEDGTPANLFEKPQHKLTKALLAARLPVPPE